MAKQRLYQIKIRRLEAALDQAKEDFNAIVRATNDDKSLQDIGLLAFHSCTRVIKGRHEEGLEELLFKINQPVRR